MGSRRGVDSGDPWSGMGESEKSQPRIEVVYARRRSSQEDPQLQRSQDVNRERRLGPAVRPRKKNSFTRSLTTRGRTSVVIVGGVDYLPKPKQREAKKKPKQSKQKTRQDPPDFSKEMAYFKEVDSYELLEESPSPKKYSTWATGTENDPIVIPDLASILERWLISRKLTYSCGPSRGLLPRIAETPVMPLQPMCIPEERTLRHTSAATASSKFVADRRTPVPIELVDIDSPVRRVSSTFVADSRPPVHIVLEDVDSPSEGASSNIVADRRASVPIGSVNIDSSVEKSSENHVRVKVENDVDESLEQAIKKLSLTSSSTCDHRSAFEELLLVCNQSCPSSMSEVFSQYCDMNSIVKIGEGTYGEAFKAGASVCKIVPVDGDLLVNGEVQKRSEEVLEEVLLSFTLNSLRQEGRANCGCKIFIETKDIRLCQGTYDASLIRAWEDWDAKHGSENDHPKEFSEDQCYVVFVLADGGRDLESFVLLNFDEARSLLVQVTAALAVAEVACEFEHRDLHWGNVLLVRNESTKMEFKLEGRKICGKTFGISVSIIDFTLSRINSGEAILFLDLSLDPALFEGPKSDRQSETYRKMKEITEDCWESRHQRTTKDERDLRSLKKRMQSYDSAKDALSDPFFTDLLEKE
ncbi:hypothetical protein QJS10_CPB17g00885 [Acorus calamus]|uniref:non-specific serine/threonine protein kinase n=1 Tax=Acorus calamus TaxID=4465 RepID=A0AAV9CWF3_ACOCL|nr:hypothetical protein QJS10_CPB17g00885 [Acorus calamus]